jgi:hypothetical protein
MRVIGGKLAQLPRTLHLFGMKKFHDGNCSGNLDGDLKIKQFAAVAVQISRWRAILSCCRCGADSGACYTQTRAPEREYMQTP